MKGARCLMIIGPDTNTVEIESGTVASAGVFKGANPSGGSLRFVEFPCYVEEYGSTAHRYYHTHFHFILSIFKYLGCQITFFHPELDDKTERTHLRLRCDGISVLFDISDYQDTLSHEVVASADVVFKFHYSRRLHSRYPTVFAFSPISFYDWDQFYRLRSEISYQGRGLILNNQRPHNQSQSARTFVQQKLGAHFHESEIDLTPTPQEEFWRNVNTALVSVCVPGARMDILDRGQLQYIGFGACTVSPRLSNDLPRQEQFLPNVHYLECKPDWSDLIDIIQWARSQRQVCLNIARYAQELFSRILTVEALFEWMTYCLESVRSSIGMRSDSK